MTEVAKSENSPRIGAFVLETLTLGMYGEPRHTLREYVQNAFDAIQAATRLGYLKGKGIVQISLSDNAIAIKDNGIGVSAKAAWDTLTAIGASKKQRQKEAGFRGIGRLAGMAYCSKLIFRTSYPGEREVSRIEFDCEKIIKAIGPDATGESELVTLLADAVQAVDGGTTSPDDHFFEVILEGLEEAPDQLKDYDSISAYLAETVPVDYDWARATEIRQGYEGFFGKPMETLELQIFHNGAATNVAKKYGDEYEIRGGTASIAKIEVISDDQNGWWGWVGILDAPAAVTDWSVRGIRLRLRNIQVGGPETVEKLFSEVKPSYGRLSAYFVGEIFLAPDRLIPNARRDGFEEDRAWAQTKSSLIDLVCAPMAAEAYARSRRRQTELGKLLEDVADAVDSAAKVREKANYDHVVDLMARAKRLRRKIISAQREVEDIDEAEAEEPEGASAEPSKASRLAIAAKDVRDIEDMAKALLGKAVESASGLDNLRKRIRSEAKDEILDIVKHFVDIDTFHAIKSKVNAEFI